MLARELNPALLPNPFSADCENATYKEARRAKRRRAVALQKSKSKGDRLRKKSAQKEDAYAPFVSPTLPRGATFCRAYGAAERIGTLPSKGKAASSRLTPKRPT